MSRGVALEEFFRKYLDRYPDMRSITLNTAEGTTLCAVNRSDWDGNNLSNLIPSFTVSFDQSSRLNMGGVNYILVWKDGAVILQFKIELIVVAILFDENANVGLLEDFLPSMSEALKPYCVALTSQS